MENPLAPTACDSPAPQPVDLAAIEEELARFWHDPEAPEAGSSVTRACMANLVIFCRNIDEEREITQEIPSIVASHPARVLLLVADVHRQSEGLEAFVRAHRRLTEEGQQIYSEHVTVRAGSASIRRLPSTVRSLLLGDLATTLWWATPEAPPLHGTLFDELADLADQVIYDSVAWTDPLRQLIVMADWIGRGHAKVLPTWPGNAQDLASPDRPEFRPWVCAWGAGGYDRNPYRAWSPCAHPGLVAGRVAGLTSWVATARRQSDARA